MMHSMEDFLKEFNEIMHIEKHSMHLSAKNKLFEKAVKIMQEMEIVLRFYHDCKFEEYCFT